MRGSPLGQFRRYLCFIPEFVPAQGTLFNADIKKRDAPSGSSADVYVLFLNLFPRKVILFNENIEKGRPSGSSAVSLQ